MAFLFLSERNFAQQTQITFYTTMGDFVVEMYDSITPITSGNFIDLVKQGYYDGIIFHRVIDNFMVQGGDPTGTGSGGPGYTIPDEFDSRASNVQKTISMANSGPNTGGSQFFINLVDNTYLDYDKAPTSSKHAVFGIVVQGFQVVQNIGKVATNSSDRPITDVVMDSLRITHNPFTGITEKTKSTALQLFPNPTNRQGTLQYEAAVNEQLVVTLFDALGKRIVTTEVTASRGMNRWSLSTLFPATLAEGRYTIQLSGNNSSAAIQMVFMP